MKKGIKYFLFCFWIPGSCICFGQNTNVDSLLTILKSSKYDTTKVNTLNDLFLEYEFFDTKKAEEYLKKALELSQKTDYKKGLADTHMYLGYFAEDKGNFPEALKNYSASLKINETAGRKKGEADSYNSIGNVYGNQGNYPEALKNYFASLKIREATRLPNGQASSPKGIAAAYGNIGSVYYFQGNYPEALKNQTASLKIMKSIGNKLGSANAYNNIGIIYAAQADYSEALNNYFSCLKIMEAIGNKAGIADSYITIANVYSSQAEREGNPEVRAKKLNEALKNLFASLKLKEELGSKSGIALSYMNIGNVFRKQKKYAESEKYLLKARDLSREIGQLFYLRNTFVNLTVLDSSKGDFKGAYNNHKLYILYRDSLDNEETRKKTIQNQMTYDFEKKEAVADAEHKKELENQETIAEEKNRKQKVVLILVSGFLALVLFFAGFIFRSLRLTRKQKIVIEEQKELVEEKQKEILDSIYYARRIQRSLLPTEKYIERNLKRLKKS